MDFKIKKSEFLNLLKWTQGIVEKKSPMMILSNLLLEAKEKLLRITATDLEIVLAVEGGIEGRGNGSWVVSARHLYEIVKEAPEEEIKVSGNSTKGLELSSGRAQFKIVGMNPEEFPSIPSASGKTEISVDSEDLSEMIDNTFYAVSTDETRYTLNGLYFVGIPASEGNENLRIVATDGHRLSYSERARDKKWHLDKGLLVPRKGIQELRKLLSEGTGDLLVSSDEKMIRFRRGSIDLAIRLIEGEFPAYEQVIPKKSDKIVSLGRETLSGALKRASIMTSTEGRGVKLQFSSNLLEISSAHPDLGETREELAIDYKGAKFEVAFNPRYLVDLLAVLEDEKVVLELKDEVSPCVIRSEFDKGFLALVMPMRI